MSITQTVLVFVVIPVAVVAVVFALVYAASARRSDRRYRPGRPFGFTPVWFLAAPDGAGAGQPEQHSLTAGADPAALPAGSAGEDTERPAAVRVGAVGGASDRW